MSLPQSDIAVNGDIDLYFTNVCEAFLRALTGNNKAIYPRISYVVPAGARKAENVAMGQRGVRGEPMMGTRVRFPVPIGTSRPRIWPPGQPRKRRAPGLLDISVDLNRYAPESIFLTWETFSQDLFGIVQDLLPQMMDRGLILWDDVLAYALTENANFTDGLPFFTPITAPHQADPFNLGVGTFYNDVPVTGIDIGEMRRVLSILESIPGPDGLPLDTDQCEVKVLAPTTDMQVQLLQVFQEAIAAAPVGANAAASVSNALYGRATIELYKLLNAQPIKPIFGGNAQDPGKTGYMLVVPKGPDRPLAVIPGKNPEPYYSGLNGSDYIRASMGEVEFGWTALGAAKLMIPQRALRFIVNPV